jgi:hypothetical protein
MTEQQARRWQGHANRCAPTQEFASAALRVAAASLKSSDSALGAYYRARWKALAAITATAHKLTHIIYFLLKERIAYHDFGADHYEQQYRKRVLRNLNRRTAKIGFRLEPSVLPVSQGPAQHKCDRYTVGPTVTNPRRSGVGTSDVPCERRISLPFIGCILVKTL